MNVVILTRHGFQLVMPGLVASGAGRPPVGCFATPAIILDLRPLDAARAAALAMLLPIADPDLPEGHAFEPLHGVVRWDTDTVQAPLIAAPDVLAALARRAGVRVLAVL